ncbi:hypothetical protein, partial [Bacillus sp. FJAT-27445]|uniref:hypothetical protein n=1 Tax=Bacillus sp. FJAT-27445 TaxID=1679166 RepID=UPI000ADFB1B8
QLDDLIKGLEDTAKADIAAAGLAVETSAYANFDRVIGRIVAETPLKVDKQKLDWITESHNKANGIIPFKIVNENEFDVVFRYTFKTDSKTESGVSETPFAQSEARPGVTSLNFDVKVLEKKNVKYDEPGWLYVEYMDENGKWQELKKHGEF